MSENMVLTIDYAKDCARHLLSLFNASGDIMIDVSDIADIDLSGMQLLMGTLKKAKLAGLNFRLTGALNSGVEAKIRGAGICKEPCTTGERLEQAFRSLC